jgi:peptidoglycan/xylan/chitin deacetylase (PgdA/CDA1 family)
MVSANETLGSIITACTTSGTLALTFDDGPYNYTTTVLDMLDKYSIKATFFITGNNLGKGRIDDASTPWPAILRRMYSSGHQLASHTWTHQDLTAVNATIRQQQVIYNEMAFRNLFGLFPTYMRPPYATCTSASGCLADLTALGYHIVNFNVDTKDYLYNTADLIQTSKDIFSSTVSNTSAGNAYIELSHDTQYQTAINFTEYMITTAQSRGYSLVTVGECLGDAKENWYRSAVTPPSSSISTTSSVRASSTSSSPPPASTSLDVSTDGSCAAKSGNKYTCLGSKFGNCCSVYGNW